MYGNESSLIGALFDVIVPLALLSGFLWGAIKEKHSKGTKNEP